MSRVRAKHAIPELTLRKALSAMGLRSTKVSGRPDIVFPTERIAIYCDGDFWHGRNWPARKDRQFNVRRKYWIGKIEDNIRRDRRLNRKLRAQGWVVLRYWESKIRTDCPGIANEAKKMLRAKRSGRGGKSRTRVFSRTKACFTNISKTI